MLCEGREHGILEGYEYLRWLKRLEVAMKFSLLALSICVGIFASCKSRNTKTDLLVANGRETSTFEYVQKLEVMLEGYDTPAICTAVFLSPTTALTSRHCVQDSDAALVNNVKAKTYLHDSKDIAILAFPSKAYSGANFPKLPDAPFAQGSDVMLIGFGSNQTVSAACYVLTDYKNGRDCVFTAKGQEFRYKNSFCNSSNAADHAIQALKWDQKTLNEACPDAENSKQMHIYSSRTVPIGEGKRRFGTVSLSKYNSDGTMAYENQSGQQHDPLYGDMGAAWIVIKEAKEYLVGINGIEVGKGAKAQSLSDPELISWLKTKAQSNSIDIPDLENKATQNAASQTTQTPTMQKNTAVPPPPASPGSNDKIVNCSCLKDVTGTCNLVRSDNNVRIPLVGTATSCALLCMKNASAKRCIYGN